MSNQFETTLAHLRNELSKQEAIEKKLQADLVKARSAIKFYKKAINDAQKFHAKSGA